MVPLLYHFNTVERSIFLLRREWLLTWCIFCTMFTKVVGRSWKEIAEVSTGCSGIQRTSLQDRVAFSEIGRSRLRF